jgi:hypothetical protein
VEAELHILCSLQTQICACNTYRCHVGVPDFATRHVWLYKRNTRPCVDYKSPVSSVNLYPERRSSFRYVQFSRQIPGRFFRAKGGCTAHIPTRFPFPERVSCLPLLYSLGSLRASVPLWGPGVSLPRLSGGLLFRCLFRRVAQSRAIWPVPLHS